MKFVFKTFGKNHEPYVQAGIKEFSARIERYYPLQWQIIAPPKNAASLQEEELKRREAEILLPQLHKDDFLITLDEKGKSLSSVQLATFLEQRALESVKTIVFLIGGAYGIDDSVRQRSNLILSFSAFTFPHQLVRLILAEQVYRACTIIRKEKYHHQ